MSHNRNSSFVGGAGEAAQARVKAEIKRRDARNLILIEAAKQFLKDGTTFEKNDSKEAWHATLLKELPLENAFWARWNDEAWNGSPPQPKRVEPVYEVEEEYPVSEAAAAQQVKDFDISDPRRRDLEQLPDSDLQLLATTFRLRPTKVFSRSKTIDVLVQMGLGVKDLPQ